MANDSELILDIVGLGAPEGFLGSDNEQVIMDVYHRYQEHQRLIGAETPGHYTDQCHDSCPHGTHCVWGICFCDSGRSLINIPHSSLILSLRCDIYDNVLRRRNSH